MDARPARNGSSPTASAPLSEKIAVVLILVFPIMGTFFAPESYFAPQDFSIEGMGEAASAGGFPFGRLGYLLTLLWLIPQLVIRWQLMLPALLRSALPLAFVLWTLATAIWAFDPAASINRSFRVLILVMFAIYLVERYDGKEILRFLLISGTIAIVASVAAVVAIPQYGLSHLIGYENAWRGATLHKNTLGALMCLVFVVGYYSLRTGVIKPQWCIGVVMGSLFLVVMSRSATSLLNVMISIMLFTFLNFINRLQRISEKVLVASVAVICLVIVYIGRSAIDTVLEIMGRSSDFTGRADIWEMAWELIGQHPIIGIGSGFWQSDSLDRAAVWSTLGWAPPSAHSTFLDIWLQLGLVGLVIAILMLLTVAFRTVGMLARGTQTYNLIWPLLVMTTLIGGMSETYLVSPGAASMFSLTLAFASLAKREGASSARRKTARVVRRNYGRRQLPVKAGPMTPFEKSV